MEAEINVFSNYSFTQENFSENFQEYSNGIYVYTPGVGDVPEIENLLTITETDKNKLVSVLNDYTGSDFSQDSLSDLKGYIISEIEGDFTLFDFISFLNNERISFKQNFTEYETTGYSKGDFARVIVPGKTEKKKETQQFINNIFWDAPICVTIDLEISGKSYSFREYEVDLSDYWNWPFGIDDAKKIVLKFIADYFKSSKILLPKILETVEKSFPDEIKY